MSWRDFRVEHPPRAFKAKPAPVRVFKVELDPEEARIRRLKARSGPQPDKTAAQDDPGAQIGGEDDNCID